MATNGSDGADGHALYQIDFNVHTPRPKLDHRTIS